MKVEAIRPFYYDMRTAMPGEQMDVPEAHAKYLLAAKAVKMTEEERKPRRRRESSEQ